MGQLIDGDKGLGRRAGEEGDVVEGEDREGVEAGSGWERGKETGRRKDGR